MHSLDKLAVLGLLTATLLSAVYVPISTPTPEDGGSAGLTEYRRDVVEGRGLGLAGLIVGIIGVIQGLGGICSSEVRARRKKEQEKQKEEEKKAREKKEDDQHKQVMGNLTMVLGEVRGVRGAMKHFYGKDSFPGLLGNLTEFKPEGAKDKDWIGCVKEVMRGRWFGGDPIKADIDEVKFNEFSVQLKMPIPCLNIVRPQVNTVGTDEDLGTVLKDCTTHEVLGHWSHKDCILVEGINEKAAREVEGSMNKMDDDLAREYKTELDDEL